MNKIFSSSALRRLRKKNRGSRRRRLFGGVGKLHPYYDQLYRGSYFPEALQREISGFAHEPLTDDTIRNAVLYYMAPRAYGTLHDETVQRYGHISLWDTSRVTNMYYLFGGYEKFNEDISEWDTGNVIYFNHMFKGCHKFNQPIGRWNVSRAREMRFMFCEAYKFNQPLNNWNVSNVTTFEGMFQYAFKFNQPLDRWNVSNAINFFNMFDRAIMFRRHQSASTNDWILRPGAHQNFLFHVHFHYMDDDDEEDDDDDEEDDDDDD